MLFNLYVFQWYAQCTPFNVMSVYAEDVCIGTGKVLSCLQVLNYVAEKVYMGNYEKGVRIRD